MLLEIRIILHSTLQACVDPSVPPLDGTAFVPALGEPANIPPGAALTLRAVVVFQGTCAPGVGQSVL